MGEKSRLETMKVPPEFKRLVKVRAAKKGKTMAEMLREVSEEEDKMNELLKEKKKEERRGRSMDFDLGL